MRKFIEKHTVAVSVFGVLLVSFPEWFQSVWSLFSSEPAVPALVRFWRAIDLPVFSPYWISVPVGISIFIAVFIVRVRRGAVPSYVPMIEATTRAYEELRSANSLWAATAERFAGSALGKTHEEGVRLYIATAFTTIGLPLYGRRAPSRIYERIPEKEFKRGSFLDNGASFKYFDAKFPVWVEIGVRKDNLDDAIAKMKADSSMAR